MRKNGLAPRVSYIHRLQFNVPRCLSAAHPAAYWSRQRTCNSDSNIKPYFDMSRTLEMTEPNVPELQS